jgi:hypothetical protein
VKWNKNLQIITATCALASSRASFAVARLSRADDRRELTDRLKTIRAAFDHFPSARQSSSVSAPLDPSIVPFYPPPRVSP